MNVHFSSKHHGYETPAYVFDPLNGEFNFDLDVCAVSSTAKCAKYIDPDEDALDINTSWRATRAWWCNPPYGRGPRGLPGFVAKAIREIQQAYGKTGVMLVPARTDTEWFRRAVSAASEIRFVEGRIKFVGMKNGAPFPSAIIVLKQFPRRNGPSISWVEFP